MCSRWVLALVRREAGHLDCAHPGGCCDAECVGLGEGGGVRAQVALASRIYVEGRHDAELVEQVWGHDLRVEGVVVEPLGGVDDLVDIVAEFKPPRAASRSVGGPSGLQVPRRHGSRKRSGAVRVGTTRLWWDTPMWISGKRSSRARGVGVLARGPSLD